MSKINKEGEFVVTYDLVEELSECIHHKPHIILVINDDNSLSSFTCEDQNWNKNLLLALALEDDNFSRSLFEVCNGIRSHRANQKMKAEMLRTNLN